MAIHSSILAWRIPGMGGAWWAAVSGFAQSQTQLKQLSSSINSSVTQLCLTLCNPMDHSMPGLSVHHQLLELAETHVHQVGNAIQPSPSLLSLSPPAFNLYQHQDLFQSQFFVSGGQSIGVSASASVFPMNIQD